MLDLAGPHVHSDTRGEAGNQGVGHVRCHKTEAKNTHEDLQQNNRTQMNDYVLERISEVIKVYSTHLAMALVTTNLK